MGVGILAKRVVLELGLQHQLCLQSEQCRFGTALPFLLNYYVPSKPHTRNLSIFQPF